VRAKTYPKYKKSGIEWLGLIPAHWEIWRIKHLAHVRRGASPRPIEDAIYFDDDGEYAWVRISDLTASERYLEETTQRLSKLGQSKSVCLEPGELFVSIAATVGKPIITRIKCCIHDGFVHFDGLTTNAEFLWYLLQCGEAYKGLGKLGTQLNLNTETVGGICVPVPNAKEQVEIVGFLDRETAKIDALVEKKERLIELLQEKRTALITHAVTQGLDPNVPMGDSGIEWLGQIPAHWESCFLGKAFSIQGGYAFPSSDFVADGIPVIRMGNLKSGILDVSEAVFVEKSAAYTEFALASGDLVVGMSGSLDNYAWISTNDVPCQLNQRVGRVRSRRNRDLVRYAMYVLVSWPSSSQIEVMATGTAQQNISAWQIEHVYVALPPIREQCTIVDFLDRETEKIDTLISKIQEAIERLREYRTALISAAVTGKIDVRGHIC